MEPSLLSQGVELMVAGMGTVFVFLTVLVGAVTLMSRLTARFLPDTPEPTLAATPSGAAGSPTQEEVAAISAAIARHRSRSASH